MDGDETKALQSSQPNLHSFDRGFCHIIRMGIPRKVEYDTDKM